MDQNGNIPGSAVPEETSSVRRENAMLREDNDDLRASALWWKTLYEDALRRLNEVGVEPRTHPSMRRVHTADGVIVSGNGNGTLSHGCS